MSADPKQPADPKRRTTELDDPWTRLSRANKAAQLGIDLSAEEIGDAERLVTHERTNATLIQGPGPSTEILQLVTESLAAAPERADLWMMRFEVQKTLGLKQEFSEALVSGWHNPRVRSALPWDLIRAMWEELAHGEPAPADVRFPEVAPPPTATTGAGLFGKTAPSTARNRRFSDLAVQLAARELAVLAKAYAALHSRPGFMEDFARKVAPMLRRPTPLQFAEGLSRISGSRARIFLKREDQRKVTPDEENATAQAYLAVMMGRPALITGNDVDTHSLALATVAPRFNLKCTVVVRPSDLEQKAALIQQLRALGAQIETMAATGATGTDPREGALRLWQKSMGHAHLALSLGTGPNPYPAMINNFQSLLGRETELQLRALGSVGRPRTLVAAVESEADSIGFMLPQLGRQDVELMYAEPEPGGVQSWRPSARLRAYNGAIREHAWLRASGRIEHVTIPDAQAKTVQYQVSNVEKIQVSLEDARAIALTKLLTQRDPNPRDFVVLVA